jgi:hypothetical protein
MSQTVIFSIGSGVFALTVWGAVMAGGVWLGQLAESDDDRSPQQPIIADDPHEVRAPDPS